MPSKTKLKAPPAPPQPEMMTRFLSAADIEAITENRVLKFTFSSTRPVTRWMWFDEIPEGGSTIFNEVLSHDPQDWDLERVDNGVCPYLKNHNRHDRLGTVNSVSFEGDQASCEASLRLNPEADQHMVDVNTGHAKGVSFGYVVRKYEVLEAAVYEGEGWDRTLKTPATLLGKDILLIEVSSETIPADPTVGHSKGMSLRSVSIQGDPNFFFRANADDLSVGDFVSWSASGGTAQGRITRKATSGTVTPEPSGSAMEGSPDNPAFLVNNYQEEDEGWVASDVSTVHRAAALTKIEALKSIEPSAKNPTNRKTKGKQMEEIDQLRSQVKGLEDELNQVKSQVSDRDKEISQRDARISELTNEIGVLNQRTAITSRYHKLRAVADDLVSDTKLTGDEFKKMFGDDPVADIEQFVKSDGDARLDKIDFFLDMATVRSPALNTRLRTGDEPLTRTVKEEPDEEDEKKKQLEEKRQAAAKSYATAWEK